MSRIGRFEKHRMAEELLKAARDGNKDEGLNLLANGADVNGKDNYGRTPLHSASSRGHTDLAEVLIANGADVNGKSNGGWTPLHRASSCGHTDLAEVLIANGANVNGKDEHGNTPLHYASRCGHTNLAEVLIANGADVNDKNNVGNTPLHYASRCGHTDLAEVLIAKGADINVKNNDGDTPLDVAKSRSNGLVANLLEAAHAKQNTLIHLRATNQNQEIIHENVGSGEVADWKHDKLPHEDGKDKKSAISNTPTDRDQFKLTDEDLHFLMMGRELVREGGNVMPVISDDERTTLQTLAKQMVYIERSLESVRELPPSLSDREPEVSKYFFSFTNAFARAFTAAQVLGSGAVKPDVHLHWGLQTLLGGASWVAENCNLHFVGCISIFSAIILHQQETKTKNTFMAFEDFFRGNSRDQYLVTYGKLAEAFCLQLDISLLNRGNSGKTGRLKEQLHTKIVKPIQKHLRQVHLNAIQELSPVEVKAMADLASLTKEVLRLHQDEHHTYDELRTSNECVKASYFVEHIFGKTLISPHPEQKPSTNETTQNSSWEKLTDQNQSHSTEDEARLQHLLEEIEKMKEQNANMAATNTKMQAQLRKLADKVKSQKDLTVRSGNQAQAQMNPNKADGDVQQKWQDFNYVQMEQDIRQSQAQQEKQSQDADKMKLENFINNRVLSYREAFELTHNILSIADPDNGNKIEVSENGRFLLGKRDYCIGVVQKGGPFPRRQKLWKGKVGIKLEEEHHGIKSIMYWFDKIELRPLYERNKRKAIISMFADELDSKLFTLPCK